MKSGGEYFQPIATIPERLKDGRPVLGFNENAARQFQKCVMKYNAEHERWFSIPDEHYFKPSHWWEL